MMCTKFYMGHQHNFHQIQLWFQNLVFSPSNSNIKLVKVYYLLQCQGYLQFELLQLISNSCHIDFVLTLIVCAFPIIGNSLKLVVRSPMLQRSYIYWLCLVMKCFAWALQGKGYKLIGFFLYHIALAGNSENTEALYTVRPQSAVE